MSATHILAAGNFGSPFQLLILLVIILLLFGGNRLRSADAWCALDCNAESGSPESARTRP